MQTKKGSNMKRLIPLLLMAAMVGVLAVGCTPAGEKDSDEASQTTEVEITSGSIDYGKLLTVTLEENQTTGYSWDYAIEGDTIRLAADNYIPADSEGEEIAGAGGHHDYIFEGSKEGTATITFTHGQQWEGGEQALTVTLRATTNAEGIFTEVRELL